MSIATLLHHVGIMVPRYVTVDGQVVLDGSPGVGGASLAMEPHRFHAGDDPSPSRTAFATAWWNSDAEARAADEAAMRKHFPTFVLLEQDDDYVWGGELNTGRGSYRILVYPHVDRSMPSIVPLRKNLGRTEGRRSRKPPHMYDSGSLCVAATSDWDPERHNTATAVAWAAHWFAAYTEWRMRGQWPTDGYGAAA